ncbi:MAG: hypothetical protein AAGI89_08205, partial [Pseudomonadota bacterium]
GSITDGAQGSAGDDVNAGGTTLSATTTIVLDDQTHDFGGAVNASGTTVTLADANSIALGDIDTAGTLTVVAVSGSIDDGAAAGTGLDIDAGGADLTAGGNITINDASNVIGGTFTASGDNLVLDFAGVAPTIASIVAGGNLALEVDGILTGGPFDVTGTSTLTSNNGSITLLDSANNVFGGVVTANAEDAITILTDGALSADATAQAAGGLDSGNIVMLTAGGNLTASALGNDINLTGANVSLGAIDALEDAANAGGSLMVTATAAAGTIDGTPTGDVTVEGLTSLNGPGGVSLVDASNDFVGGVTVSALLGAIALTDANDLTITSLIIGTDLANDLDLTAGGTLTTAAILANDVTLNASTIATPGVTTQNGGALIFTADTDISGATIAFDIAGDSTFTSNNGSILLEDATDMFGGAIAAAAPSATGSVTINLAGDRTISAQAGSAGSTTASNTVNVTAGGMLTITEVLGNGVTVRGTDLTLFDVDVEGTLVAEATLGAITDDTAVGSGSDVNVTGTSNFTAVTDVTLDDATNDFGGAVTVTATNGAITIADANALTLIARAGTSGSITSANTVDATANGLLTITEALGYTVNATGGSVSLGAINAQQDGILTGGDLTVVANTGSIDDDATGDLAVAGDASFTAQTDATSITIDNAANAIGGTLTADGHDVTFDFAGGSPTIASILASGVLNLEADGDLSGGFLQVTEAANLTSNAGSISFTDSANNSFGGLVTALADGAIDLRSDGPINVAATAQASGGLDASNTVTIISQGTLDASALGNTIDLTGTSVSVGEVDALATAGSLGGDLMVTATDTTLANATIDDAGVGDVLVQGTTNLVGPGGIALDDASHDFVGAVTASATSATGSVVLVDANALEIASAVAGDLAALEAGNSIDITSGALLTATIAQGRDITLEGTSVVLGSVETGLDGALAGGSLMVTANTGTITDNAAILIAGTSQLMADGDVTIDQAGTDFTGAVTATSTNGAITLTDLNQLTVTALAGTIGNLTAANSVEIVAGGDLVATQARGNAIDLEGTSVDLGDIDALEDTLSAGGSLMVMANSGAITDSQAILVDGTSQLTALGDIVVDEVGTDFVGAVTAVSTSGAISLADANDLSATARAGTSGAVTAANTVVLDAAGVLTATETLGYTVDLSGSNVSLGDVATEQDAVMTAGSGALTVIADTGSIDDDTAGSLNVAGDASFTAAMPGTSIVVDGVGNTVGGVVTADGNDITFAFAASQVMGAVRATGNLILSAVGALSGGPLDVDGATQLTSSTDSINFVDSANSFDGLVTANADGSIDLSGGATNLTVDATAGTEIDLATTAALDVTSSGGATTLDGGTVAITSVQASSLDAMASGDITGGAAIVTGLTDLTSSSGTINLTGTNFQGQVTATVASASGAVTLSDVADLDVIATAGTTGALTAANTVDVTAAGQLTVAGLANDLTAAGSSVVLGNVDVSADTLGAGGALMVTADTGSVTDTGPVLVADTTTVNAASDIVLDNAANDFAGLVTATSTGGSVTIADASALSAVLSAAGDASASATGDLTATADASSVVLSGSMVQLDDIDAAGDLTVTATAGGITDGATMTAGSDVDVGGTTQLIATAAVELDDTTNNFGGTVSAAGSAVTLTDADGLEIADIDTAGDLVVTAVTGSITDGLAIAVGDDINVGGDATFTVTSPAAGSSITIDDTTHDFGGTVTASGLNVTLGFSGDQVLGSVTTAGDFAVTTDGDLSGGPLVVGGTTSLASTAGSLSFTDAGNGFSGQVTADAAQDVSLADSGDLDVVAIAGGTVDLSAGGALSADTTGGATTLTGNTINIVSISASSLDAIATGAITGGNASVSGVTSLISTNDAIMLTNNAFIGRVTATAAGAIDLTQTADLSVEATGETLTLSSDGMLTTTATGTTVSLNGGDVAIETITASQALSVVASNTITGGVVDVATSTDLTAGGDIDLSSTSNRFGTDLSTMGANISIGTSGDFTLGMTNASGDFTVVTDGSIADGASPVIVAGRSDITAGGSVILDNTANDFGGGVSATGTSIELADANSLALGNITTAGTLRIVFDADRAASPDTDVQLTDADGTMIMVDGATDISTGLDASTSILSDAGGPSINLDNATHRFAGGLALRRIGGSAFVSETADASTTALTLRNLEVGEDLTIQTGRSVVLVGRLTSEENGVFGLEPRLTSGQSSASFAAEQGTDGLDEASFHLFIPDGATWTFDTTAGGSSATGADIRIDRPVDSLGSLSLSVDDIGTRQDNATTTGSLSLAAGTAGEVRFRDFVGANRPLGLVRVLTAGSAFIGSTRATSPVDEEDDAFLMARNANPVSNADLNLRDFFYAASLSFEDVTGNAQVLVPQVHANNGFEFFGLNVTGGDGSFEGGTLDGRGISGFAFGGSPDFLEVFGGIAPSGGDIIRGASAGLVADGINISSRTTFNGCQVGDTSTCINLDIPVVVTAPQNTLTVDTVAMDDPNDSNFLAFGNEQLWANPPTFFILAPLPAATEE